MPGNDQGWKKKKKVQPGGNITMTDFMKEIKEGGNLYLLT